MKRLFFFILISLSSLVVADDSATKLLDKYANYYKVDYEGYLKSKYELSISEYYWKRVKDVRAFGEAVKGKTDKLSFLNEEARNDFHQIRNSDLDSSQKILKLRSRFYQLQHQQLSLRQNLESLKVAINSEHLSCSAEHLTMMETNLDPELMYVIPQYAFDPSGAPKLDIHYYFSMSYSNGSGFGGETGAEQTMSKDQEIIVYAGAAAVTAVASIFIQEPTTLSMIFAGTAAVLKFAVGVFSSMASSDEYVRQMKKLVAKYKELNLLIASKHSELSVLRSGIIKDRCQSILGPVSNPSVLKNYLISLMDKVSETTSNEEVAFEHIQKDLESEEISLLGKVTSDRDFFQNYNSYISSSFMKQISKLFEFEMALDRESLVYFLERPSLSAARLRGAHKTGEKMKHLNNLWTDLIEGDAKYNSQHGPQSINWKNLKKSLENGLSLEAR